MNLSLISMFLLIISFRNVSFEFIMIFMSCGPLLYMFIGLGVDGGGVGMWLPWCSFKASLCCLHHHQMAVNDLVYLVCVCLMF